MDFELSQEMKMLKEMAYKFAVAEVGPVSQECDEHEKYTPDIRKKAAQTDWSEHGYLRPTAVPAQAF